MVCFRFVLLFSFLFSSSLDIYFINTLLFFFFFFFYFFFFYYYYYYYYYYYFPFSFFCVFAKVSTTMPAGFGLQPLADVEPTVQFQEKRFGPKSVESELFGQEPIMAVSLFLLPVLVSAFSPYSSLLFVMFC